jgi:hypothetical protein
MKGLFIGIKGRCQGRDGPSRWLLGWHFYGALREVNLLLAFLADMFFVELI